MDLPGAPEIALRDGRLMVEGVAAVDLARRFATPLYVYSSAAMARALASYQSALSGRDHLLCYAVKANSTLAILQWFARRGCGFDIVSGGELERVLAAGGDPARIVFSGVGKTRAEMERALAVDVRCFNVESVGELELLSEVARRPAGARASACASIPTSTQDASLHLDRPARQQVRHRPRRRAGRVRARRAACPESK
jgi:diaminopimelate decarboxylase